MVCFGGPGKHVRGHKGLNLLSIAPLLQLYFAFFSSVDTIIYGKSKQNVPVHLRVWEWMQNGAHRCVNRGNSDKVWPFSIAPYASMNINTKL